MPEESKMNELRKELNKKSVEIKEKESSSVVSAALVALGITMLGVIFAIIFVPDGDKATIIGTIIAMATPTTASILAYMKAQETHLSVNSRLDAFIKNAEMVAAAIGREEGRKEANARTDMLNLEKEQQEQEQLEDRILDN